MASTMRQSSAEAAEMDAFASKYVGYWFANIFPLFFLSGFLLAFLSSYLNRFLLIRSTFFPLQHYLRWLYYFISIFFFLLVCLNFF